MRVFSFHMISTIHRMCLLNHGLKWLICEFVRFNDHYKHLFLFLIFYPFSFVRSESLSLSVEEREKLTMIEPQTV